MDGGGGGGGGAVAGGGGQGGFFHRPKLPYYQKTQVYKHHHYLNRNAGEANQPSNATNFDGKRMRKSVSRKTVDYNGEVIRMLERRIWQRDKRDMRWMQPDLSYLHEMDLPLALRHNPINAVTTKFIRTSTNKVRCPIFCAVWTPEGRRLVTGASSGEFTLWNGLTFNFETILQAHDYPVRTMTWSHNDQWLLTADHLGYVKYWQSNMNNVKMYQAHKDNPIRGTSFCPTDTKFATCSDDGTVRIYDFLRCHEERIMRGHGADVRAVDWHPQKGILASGSKDSQQPIKLWDPRTGTALATLHAHKNTVMGVKWNQNGNWLLTASRDHLCKLYDIRTMKEMYIFRGHKKEATAISWHPVHEDLFVSGGSDGSILFWQVGNDKEVGAIETAHDSIVWSLAWHPLGHILCSGSNDHSIKFWARNRPGDRMRDRYNLNTLPIGTSEEMLEFDDDASAGPIVPGLGLEFGLPDHLAKDEIEEIDPILETSIPGLDSSAEELAKLKPQPQRKVPYAKPIPEDFQKAWEKMKAPGIAPQKIMGPGDHHMMPPPGHPQHMNNRPPHEEGPEHMHPHEQRLPHEMGPPPGHMQGPPHGHPHRPPHDGPPHDGPPHGGPPHGHPHDGPPHGPPHGGPPHGHPHDGPDRHGPQPGHMHGPPHGREHDGPPHDGPPHGPPQDGPERHGPPGMLPHDMHEESHGPPQRGPPHGPPGPRMEHPQRHPGPGGPHMEHPQRHPGPGGPHMEHPQRHPGPGGPRMEHPPRGPGGPRMPGGPPMQRPVMLGHPEPRNKGPPSLMSLNLDSQDQPGMPSPGDEDLRHRPPPNEEQDVDLRRQGGLGGDVDLRNRFRDEDHRRPPFPGPDNGRLGPDEDFRHQSPGPRSQEGGFDPFISGDTDLRRGPPGGPDQPPVDQDMRQAPGRLPPNRDPEFRDFDDRFQEDPMPQGDTDFRKFHEDSDDFGFDHEDQDLRRGPPQMRGEQGSPMDVDLRQSTMLPGRGRAGPPGANRGRGGPPGPNRGRGGPPGPNRGRGGPPGPNRGGPMGTNRGGPMRGGSPGLSRGGPPGPNRGGHPGPNHGGPPGPNWDHDERGPFNPMDGPQKRPWEEGPGNEFGEEGPWMGEEGGMGDRGRGRGRGGFPGRGGRGRGGFGGRGNGPPGFRGGRGGRGGPRGGRGGRSRGRGR